MQLQLTDEAFIIQLSAVERLWSVRWNETIRIPRHHILTVSEQRPETTWRELRAPGTYFPGLIKAGTYYTERGKEFWYCLAPQQPVLAMDLDPAEYYKRIVLTLPKDCEISAAQFV